MDKDKLSQISEPERTAFRSLIERCEKFGIEYELEPDNFFTFELRLPSGREKREITIFDDGVANKLAEIEFEKYVFIHGYQAICCYKEKHIEAYIKMLRPLRKERLLSRLLGNYSINPELKSKNLIFKTKSQGRNGNKIIVTISNPSDAILSLTGRSPDEESGLTIKIDGYKISTNEQAITILEKISNSLFFDIRTIRSIPLMLENYRELGIYPRWIPSTRRIKKTAPITFPKYQYDADPINLYWYANSAYQMPLLQFLAYYQILEFYFPIYAEGEVQAELANVLKDPQFDPNHHLDIKKVISTVQNKMGRGYGNEKAQLLATIKGCVQDKEIRELLERSDLKNYYDTDCKKVCTIKLSIANKELDLRDQLAERLYDIRCRIVHTKAEETETTRILPFSEEETLLKNELQVIEFLARKAIIAKSQKLII